MAATDHRYDAGLETGRLDDVRLYQGVLTRRVFAFLIDYTFVLLLMAPLAILVAILGVLTLGLGWLLYGILFPLVAIPYVAFTMGGANQATPGMRLTGIRLQRLDGRRVDPLFAILHSVLFWAANVILTPLVLLLALFTQKKRTLHDLLLGTAVVRAER